MRPIKFRVDRKFHYLLYVVLIAINVAIDSYLSWFAAGFVLGTFICDMVENT